MATTSTDPYAWTPESTSNSDFSGRNPGAAGLKSLAPLDYGLLVHQYNLYSGLQPQYQDAIREAVQHLQDPQAQLDAMRSGLLSQVPNMAATQAAGLQAYGAGDSAKAGAYLNASNAANQTANSAEAAAASPGGTLQRLQALSGVIQSAQPDISRLMAESNNAGPSQSGPGFFGGLIGGLTKMIPGIGGLAGGALAGGINGMSAGDQAANSSGTTGYAGGGQIAPPNFGGLSSLNAGWG